MPTIQELDDILAERAMAHPEVADLIQDFKDLAALARRDAEAYEAHIREMGAIIERKSEEVDDLLKKARVEGMEDVMDWREKMLHDIAALIDDINVRLTDNEPPGKGFTRTLSVGELSRWYDRLRTIQTMAINQPLQERAERTYTMDELREMATLVREMQGSHLAIRDATAPAPPLPRPGVLPGIPGVMFQESGGGR